MRLAGFQPAINSPLSANEASSCEACSTLPYWVRLHSTTTYTLCTCKRTYTCNCVHVCTCSCKCTFKSVHLWRCTCRVCIFKCVWMLVELCVGLYTCTYTCMCVYMYMYMCFSCTVVCDCTCTYVFMYSCTCMNVHVHVTCWVGLYQLMISGMRCQGVYFWMFNGRLWEVGAHIPSAHWSAGFCIDVCLGCVWVWIATVYTVISL